MTDTASGAKNATLIMDEMSVRRALARVTHEIIERNRGADDLCLLGIRRRGIPIAAMLRDNILRFEGVRVPACELDVTACRDDLSPERKAELGTQNAIKSLDPLDPELPDINGKDVIMVDDVLFTGRTARAAMECIFALGRPKSLQLAVLIDRGHRELPIRADYVGKNVPTSRHEKIAVKISEIDGETCVYLNK